jgi:UDP:flavonoid glycosyltransferase YjiC (YdhE family)
MIAARVEEQGFGLSVRDTATTNYREPVKRLLTEPSFRERVRAFANKYRETSEERTKAVCDRIERYLAELAARSASAPS